jgi:iron complex outermembrane receptor protein
MKKVLMAALVCGVAQTGWAYDESEPDSIALNELSEVVVKAVKAQKYAPFAVSRIGKEEVQQFARSGQELPFLLSRTPGVTAWSENGLGTGTTYMRLRGSGDSRINVTLDGVSLNSPEDQCVFWANMNSYAALLGGMQVQRGVGTSTNGDGAFGGSVVLSTATPGLVPSAQVSASYGSYGTYNAGGKFSSGLMGNHWMLDGAYHHTGTDGYVHGTGGQSGSYYGGLTYVNTDGTLKLSYKNIGNYEKTGQAWNGVTAGNDDYSMNA